MIKTQGPEEVYLNWALKEGSIIYYYFPGLIGVIFKIV